MLNYANKDTVNGEAVDTSANNSTAAVGALGANIPSLVAFPAPFNETSDSSTTAASKLKVGPGIFELPYKLGTKFLFGDYWVVAVGELVILSPTCVPAAACMMISSRDKPQETFQS